MQHYVRFDKRATSRALAFVVIIIAARRLIPDCDRWQGQGWLGLEAAGTGIAIFYCLLLILNVCID